MGEGGYLCCSFLAWLTVHYIYYKSKSSVFCLVQASQQGPSVQVIIAQQSASVAQSVSPGHLGEAPGTASTALHRWKGENVTMGESSNFVRRVLTVLMDGVKVH